jgi:perosamine synthetase
MFRPIVGERAVERVVQTLRGGWIGEGPAVKEFERALAARLGNPHVAAVNSGTAAIQLALLVAGVGPGDEVVTTAQTMIATTQAILAVGAAPVYADVRYGTGNLDPADVAERLTPRTRAIVGVDWGGMPCDWDELSAAARPHGLAVIEDAAQALGATYRGKPVGSVCPLTCFSFQAIKQLTTGDGGLLCVSDAEQLARARRLRWFGIDRDERRPSILGEPEWSVTERGFKFQMNDVAAAMGLGNLEEFDRHQARRRAIVERYRRELGGVAGVGLFDRPADRESADWLFSIHVPRREAFCRMMQSRGIETSVVHLRIDRNPVCGGERATLPVLSRFTQTHVSLPLHPLLTDEEVGRVIDAVRSGW